MDTFHPTQDGNKWRAAVKLCNLACWQLGQVGIYLLLEKDSAPLSELVKFVILITNRGAKIRDARSPWGLDLVQWHLIFAGFQYGTDFMSSFWRLEF